MRILVNIHTVDSIGKFDNHKKEQGRDVLIFSYFHNKCRMEEIIIFQSTCCPRNQQIKDYDRAFFMKYQFLLLAK